MLKIFVINNIFVESVLLFLRIFDEQSSKEQHLFKTETLCYIINIITANFDQFNASLCT